MFDWVIYRPLKILKFQSEAKWEEIIAIVTTCTVFLIDFERQDFCISGNENGSYKVLVV